MKTVSLPTSKHTKDKIYCTDFIIELLNQNIFKLNNKIAGHIVFKSWHAHTLQVKAEANCLKYRYCPPGWWVFLNKTKYYQPEGQDINKCSLLATLQSAFLNKNKQESGANCLKCGHCPSGR